MDRKIKDSARAVVEQVRLRVRARPDEPMRLEDAAAAADLSPAHLHRVFGEIVGENFGAFVRRVRLEHACGLMRAFPRWTCTRVAYEAGFSESSDFTRTFKRAFGIPPSRWNRVVPLQRVLSDPEREGLPSGVDPDGLFPATPVSARSPVRITKLPAVRLAVMEIRSAHEGDNLRRGFDVFEAWLAARGQRRPGRLLTGLSYDSVLDSPAGQMRFELACEIDDGVRAAEGVVVRDLPATTAGVLPCRGGVKDFVAAWDHLLRGFLPGSGWRPGRGPTREVYHQDPRRHDMEYWDMDCVLPLEPADARDEEGETA